MALLCSVSRKVVFPVDNNLPHRSPEIYLVSTLREIALCCYDDNREKSEVFFFMFN